MIHIWSHKRNWTLPVNAKRAEAGPEGILGRRPCCRGGWFRNRRGLTLVEVMVALVIFGLLIVMGLPGFRKYLATHMVDGSANRLAGSLRLARQRAATEQNNYRVTFDPATQSFSILDDDNSNSVADAGEEILGPINIPTELTVTNGPLTPFPGDSLVFYPNGTASATGTVTISNSKGFWRLVAVVRSTGAVALR
jgi:prepilin-type N-terminal cleavage/methylation domain-containing protein